MMRTFVHVAVLLSMFCLAQTSVATDIPCNPKNKPAGWRTFVDRAHRFCFQYPPVYKRIPNNSRRNVTTIVALQDEGQIFLWFDEHPFELQKLEEVSRSGNAAEPTEINGLTFYYNGPGGGGVDYSDDYLFNLRGKLLHIEFDGPYIHDNHPSDETKKLEPRLLATFRTF